MNELKEIIVENISTKENVKLKSLSDLKLHFKDNNNVLNFLNHNEDRFFNVLEYSYNCFAVEDWQISLIAKKKTTRKKKGNGQGSIYFDNTRQCWVGQYIYENKKRFVYQRKNETKTQFVARFNELLVKINNSTYIQKSNQTVKTIIEKHIKQKYDDGIISGRTYRRDIGTLASMEKILRFYK